MESPSDAPESLAGAREGADDSAPDSVDSGRTDAEASGEPVADAEVPLEQVVAESREKLAEAEQAPPVRKRGPYKKRTPKNPEVLPPEPEAMAPIVPLKILKRGIEVPFKIWAERTQVQEVRLADDESTDLANQVDVCVRHYLPQLSGPQSVAVTTILSFGLVALSKAMIVAEARAKREETAAAREKAANDAWAPEPTPAAPDSPEALRGFSTLAEH